MLIQQMNDAGIENTAVIDVLQNKYGAIEWKDDTLLNASGEVIVSKEDLFNSGIVDNSINELQFTNAFAELYTKLNPDADPEAVAAAAAKAAEDAAAGNASFTDGEVILIGDVEFTIDAEGNAKATDGTTYTAAELAAMSVAADESDAGNNDTNLIEQIGTLDGFTPLGEDGKPLEFENTMEGLAKRNSYILKQEKAAAVNNTFEKFFTDNPVIEDMWNYSKSNDGSMEGYNRDVTLLSIDIKEDTDEASLSKIVREAEIKRGRTGEEADRMLEYFKANELLTTEAKSAQTFLKSAKANDDSAAQLKAKTAQDAQSARIADHWGKVESIIKTGRLESLGLSIPETIKVKGADGVVKNISRDDIFAYSSKPVNERGQSQAQLDRANDAKGLDYKVLLDMLQLVGGDMSQFVKEQADTVRTQQLINRKKDHNNKGVRRFTSDAKKKGVDNIRF